MRKFITAAALGFALVACSALPPTPSSPAGAVFELESAYIAGLTLAVAYKNLPPCGPAGLVMCSDPLVVDRIRTADAIAGPALDAAKAAVRSPQAGTALGLARQAVAALLEITSKLETK